jgi:hypothetical protein
MAYVSIITNVRNPSWTISGRFNHQQFVDQIYEFTVDTSNDFMRLPAEHFNWLIQIIVSQNNCRYISANLWIVDCTSTNHFPVISLLLGEEGSIVLEILPQTYAPLQWDGRVYLKLSPVNHNHLNIPGSILKTVGLHLDKEGERIGFCGPNVSNSADTR